MKARTRPSARPVGAYATTGGNSVQPQGPCRAPPGRHGSPRSSGGAGPGRRAGPGQRRSSAAGVQARFTPGSGARARSTWRSSSSWTPADCTPSSKPPANWVSVSACARDLTASCSGLAGWTASCNSSTPRQLRPHTSWACATSATSARSTRCCRRRGSGRWPNSCPTTSSGACPRPPAAGPCAEPMSCSRSALATIPPPISAPAWFTAVGEDVIAESDHRLGGGGLGRVYSLFEFHDRRLVKATAVAGGRE